ncbi:MAG: acetyl-CoA carboxylase biotin carboxyl carrier protein subunit [Myxococcota bacterium]
MRYEVTLGEDTHSVEVNEAGGNLYDVSVDGGDRVRLDVMTTPRTVYSILLDAKQYEASVDQLEDGSFDIHVGASAFTCTVIDERRKVLVATRAGAVSGRQEIRAHIPGKIVKVLVSVGDEVELDQGLVVIEAMKMENELSSPIAGSVTEVAVAEGETVATAALLAVVEPPRTD